MFPLSVPSHCRIGKNGARVRNIPPTLWGVMNGIYPNQYVVRDERHHVRRG